jgi:hypothetical protein
MRKLLDDTDSSLQSAGILSPTNTQMMLPGTICDASMQPTLPEGKRWLYPGHTASGPDDTSSVSGNGFGNEM